MNDQLSILYVDDEEINLMLFENLFMENYKVLTAKSGIDGLEILKSNHINIVFSDMKMPEMNGLEFIQKAKNQFPKVIYYILSGYELSKEIQDALNNKLIDKYFQKPFNIQEIEDCICQNRLNKPQQ